MKKRTLIPLLLLIIIIGGFVYLGSKYDTASQVDTSDWSNYSSEEYGFELSYPSKDWNKFTAPDNEISPQFNFYIKPAGVPVDKPFIHFANITNVSVFPDGYPTEGLIGQTEQLEGDWGSNVSEENSRIYVLEDGTPFAAFIKFEEAPESWGQSGFVWARLRAENFEGVCFENGEEMGPEEQCDPLGNENITIKHRGEVNEDLWPILKKVVKSIEFSN